jgi:hypothetical protein
MSVSVSVVKLIVFRKGDVTPIKTPSMLSQLERKITICVLYNIILDLSTLLRCPLCSVAPLGAPLFSAWEKTNIAF